MALKKISRGPKNNKRHCCHCKGSTFFSLYLISAMAAPCLCVASSSSRSPSTRSREPSKPGRLTQRSRALEALLRMKKNTSFQCQHVERGKMSHLLVPCADAVPQRNPVGDGSLAGYFREGSEEKKKQGTCYKKRNNSFLIQLPAVEDVSLVNAAVLRKVEEAFFCTA